MSEDEMEATFAPGQDVSLESTEMLLEDMATTMLGAEIRKVFQLHYDAVELGQWKNHVIECKSLKATLANASQISKAGSVNPSSIKVTSHTVITTPLVEHVLSAEEPTPAPRWKVPESHPYIPEN